VRPFQVALAVERGPAEAAEGHIRRCASRGRRIQCRRCNRLRRRVHLRRYNSLGGQRRPWRTARRLRCAPRYGPLLLLYRGRRLKRWPLPEHAQGVLVRRNFDIQFHASSDTVALCRGGSWTGSSISVCNPKCLASSTCDFRDYGTGDLPVITYNGSSYLFPVNRTDMTRLSLVEHTRRERQRKRIDWIFANDVSDVDICNTEVHGGNLAIQDAGGVSGQARNNRFTVRNSAFSNMLGDALLVGSSNFTVDQNVFTNVGNASTCSAALYSATPSTLGKRTSDRVAKPTGWRPEPPYHQQHDHDGFDSHMRERDDPHCRTPEQRSGREQLHVGSKLSTNSCEGIQASASGYSTAACSAP